MVREKQTHKVNLQKQELRIQHFTQQHNHSENYQKVQESTQRTPNEQKMKTTTSHKLLLQLLMSTQHHSYPRPSTHSELQHYTTHVIAAPALGSDAHVTAAPAQGSDAQVLIVLHYKATIQSTQVIIPTSSILPVFSPSPSMCPYSMCPYSMCSPSYPSLSLHLSLRPHHLLQG